MRRRGRKCEGSAGESGVVRSEESKREWKQKFLEG
jgi:hypothetical protein